MNNTITLPAPHLSFILLIFMAVGEAGRDHGESRTGRLYIKEVNDSVSFDLHGNGGGNFNTLLIPKWSQSLVFIHCSPCLFLSPREDPQVYVQTELAPSWRLRRCWILHSCIYIYSSSNP